MRWKGVVLVVVVASVLAGVVAGLLGQGATARRLTAALCNQQELRCDFECESTHRAANDQLLNDRLNAFAENTQRLRDCIGFDVRTATQCRMDERKRYDEILVTLGRRKHDIERAYILCRANCVRKGRECRGEDPLATITSPPSS